MEKKSKHNIYSFFCYFNVTYISRCTYDYEYIWLDDDAVGWSLVSIWSSEGYSIVVCLLLDGKNIWKNFQNL